MSQLESVIASSDDLLIKGLHYAGSQTSSYITSRSNAAFVPNTASDFKSSGSRVIRFQMAQESGWLDAGTCRLLFRITNLSPTATLRPITDSPGSMFRSLRIVASGSSELERIDDYGRTHQLMSELLPASRRSNDIIESWGGTSDVCTFSSPATPDSIGPDSSRIVCVHLLSGLFSAGKMLPLAYLPITLELELSDADDAFEGVGNLWSISRPKLCCDVLQLDSSLNNSYSQHLLKGSNLPILFQGMHSIRSAIPAGSTQYTLAVARSFSRLRGIYISLYHDGAGTKYSNTFYSPMLALANVDVNDNFEFHVTIGSQRFPDFSVDSAQECFMRLRNAKLMHQGNDSVSITPAGYRNNKFITALSFEKAASATSHSGINTRSGSQLTLHLRNTNAATTAHIVLLYDAVADISLSGTVTLD
jgi:hypothetical protein